MMSELRGHCVKDIASALKDRNSIFRMAVEQNVIDADHSLIKKFLEKDRELIEKIDKFHLTLIQGGE